MPSLLSRINSREVAITQHLPPWAVSRQAVQLPHGGHHYGDRLPAGPAIQGLMTTIHINNITRSPAYNLPLSPRSPNLADLPFRYVPSLVSLQSPPASVLRAVEVKVHDRVQEMEFIQDGLGPMP